MNYRNQNHNDPWFKDTDEEENNTEHELEKLIIKFIRLRESSTFERIMREKYKCNKRCESLKSRLIKLIENPRDLTTRCKENSADLEMDISDPDSENCIDDLNTNYTSLSSLYSTNGSSTKTPMWKSVWARIMSDLNDMRSSEIGTYFKYYSSIIKLHVDHKIYLDAKCFNVFLNCTEPSLVNQVFNKGLISDFDLDHIKCLFQNQSIFHMFIPGMYNHNSKEPTYLLLSLAVLLYKTKCDMSKRGILDEMNKKLAVFVNRGRYHESFKKTALKCFLRAVLLNNLLNLSSCTNFLQNNNKNETAAHHRDHEMMNGNEDVTSSESESDASSSSEDEDMDGSDLDENNNNRRVGQVRPVGIHVAIPGQNNRNNAINNNNNNNAAAVVAKSVGDQINIKPQDLLMYFPLSLKHICRLTVKKHLVTFTPKSVEKLSVLPLALKDYVLFNDEIEKILDIAQKMKQVQRR